MLRLQCLKRLRHCSRKGCTAQKEAKVVPDVAAVDETPLELPAKKKVVRRVVKKAPSGAVTA